MEMINKLKEICHRFGISKEGTKKVLNCYRPWHLNSKGSVEDLLEYEFSRVYNYKRALEKIEEILDEKIYI